MTFVLYMGNSTDKATIDVEVVQVRVPRTTLQITELNLFTRLYMHLCFMQLHESMYPIKLLAQKN